MCNVAHSDGAHADTLAAADGRGSKELLLPGPGVVSLPLLL